MTHDFMRWCNVSTEEPLGRFYFNATQLCVPPRPHRAQLYATLLNPSYWFTCDFLQYCVNLSEEICCKESRHVEGLKSDVWFIRCRCLRGWRITCSFQCPIGRRWRWTALWPAARSSSIRRVRCDESPADVSSPESRVTITRVLLLCQWEEGHSWNMNGTHFCKRHL